MIWERLGTWFHLLWNAGEKFNAQGAVIEELQQSNQKILQIVRASGVRIGLLEKDNEMLRQQLQHQATERQNELEKVELRLRPQISEELRRLPPKDGER